MTTMTKNRFSTQSLVIMALFTAVLCVSAYISIPLPSGSHITALNFIVTIIALVFPLKHAAFIIITWMLLGCVGVPVFIGGNVGIGYLFGPLGGFSLAFLLVAIILPILCRRKYHRIYFTIVSICSVILVDLCGSLWLMISEISLKAALAAGFLPFIALDLVKAVIAAQLVPQIRTMLSRASFSFDVK